MTDVNISTAPIQPVGGIAPVKPAKRSYSRIYGKNEVLDGDYGCCWSNEGNLIEFIVFEEFVGEFDDTFLAIFFAWEIIADSDLVAELFNIEEFYDGEEAVNRYMVDNGAVFDGRYGKFSSLFHNKRLFKS